MGDLRNIVTRLRHLVDADGSVQPSLGNLLVGDGSLWQVLAPGNDDEVLTSVAGDIDWAPPATGGGGSSVAVEDDGVQVVAAASVLNFGTNLAVTDNGAGEVTIDGSGGGGAAAFTTRVAASDATAGSIAAAERTCDGTNDEVEIQAAIDEVSTAGGGIVWLSEGTFAVAATIVAKDNVIVCGMGREATSLRVPDAHGTNFDMVTGTASNFSLIDLTLDGNDPNVAQAIDGVTAPVTRGLILRCRITGMQGKGVEMTAASRWRIQDSRIDTNGSTDVRLVAGTNHEILNCESDGLLEATTATSDCIMAGNTAAAVMCDSARSIVFGNRTTDNVDCGGVDSTVWGNVLNTGRLMMDGARSVCYGNVVLSPGQNGIMVQAAEVLVIGNRVEDYTGFGIRVEAGADAQVVGNHVRSTSATNGVWLRGTASNTIVVGNDLRNSGTTPIADDTGTGIFTWPAHATYGDNFT